MSASKTPAPTKAKKPATKKPTVEAPAPKKPAHDEDIHPVARPFLFLVSEKTRKGFIYILLIATLVSIAADFFIHRHGHFRFEESFGFYAFFAFIAFSFVVLMGWPLRRFTGRSEDYYPESTEDD